VPRNSPILLALFVIAIIFVLYGTVPLITSVPHYAWVYKHIGMVQLIEARGQLDPEIDIYNRWPGFFGAAALFSSLVGEPNPVSYAGWSEIFFICVNVLLVVAIGRTLTRDVRLAWAAALIFVTANWVGQDYFSPQAFDYVIVLTILLLAIRFLPGSGGIARIPLAGRILGRWSAFATATTPVRPPVASSHRTVVITLILVLDAGAAVSHQLSPYMLLLGLAALWYFRVVKPWWLIVAMAAITIGVLAANLGYVEKHFDLFSGLDPLKNARPPATAPDPMPGRQFRARTALLLSLLVWLLMTIGIIRRLRRRDPAVVPVGLLAVTPLIIAVVQSYGGEVILRIFLFSLPFASLSIAWAIEPSDGKWRLRRAPLALALVGTLTALFIPSFFGQEGTNIMPADEVAGADYFYRNAEPGSRLFAPDWNFPVRYGADYYRFDDSTEPAWISPFCQPKPGGKISSHQLVKQTFATPPARAGRNYVVFTTTSTINLRVLGSCPPERIALIERAISDSRLFRLWYGSANIRIYEQSR
jgi:hypothetical protein